MFPLKSMLLQREHVFCPTSFQSVYDMHVHCEKNEFLVGKNKIHILKKKVVDSLHNS